MPPLCSLPPPAGPEGEPVIYHLNLLSHCSTVPLHQVNASLTPLPLPPPLTIYQSAFSAVSQFKVHEYRLVFFWSLVLGVQTPEDERTGGRSFWSFWSFRDWNSSLLDDVTTSAVLAHEFTPIIHCKLFFTVKQNITTLLYYPLNIIILFWIACDIYMCVCIYTKLKIK